MHRNESAHVSSSLGQSHCHSRASWSKLLCKEGSRQTHCHPVEAFSYLQAHGFWQKGQGGMENILENLRT